MDARPKEEALYYWGLAEAREREARACKFCRDLKAEVESQESDWKLQQFPITQRELDLHNALERLYRMIRSACPETGDGTRHGLEVVPTESCG